VNRRKSKGTDFMRGVGLKISERRLRQLVLIVVMAVLVTNCGMLRGPAKSNATTDGIFGLTLWVSRSLPSVGQPVKIRYTVTNTTDRTEVIQLEEKQEPVMDIRIFFGPGVTTLYWSDGREITPEMRRLELAPGESKTIEMTWVPDKKAMNKIVLIDGMLNREQMSQRVSIDICVDTCYLGY